MRGTIIEIEIQFQSFKKALGCINSSYLEIRFCYFNNKEKSKLLETGFFFFFFSLLLFKMFNITPISNTITLCYDGVYRDKLILSKSVGYIDKALYIRFESDKKFEIHLNYFIIDSNLLKMQL